MHPHAVDGSRPFRRASCHRRDTTDESGGATPSEHTEVTRMSNETTVEEYLAACDGIGRERLLAIREVVRAVVPEAGERISYAIPAFTIDDKVFVFMAAWKEHVSMYPLPEGDPEIDAALAPYAVSKGTVKFRHRDPLPLDVVRLVIEAKLRDARVRAAQRPRKSVS
jgi:uncharacterized protein YdhG (YjbR/CyaY superfamily)